MESLILMRREKKKFTVHNNIDNEFMIIKIITIFSRVTVFTN